MSGIAGIIHLTGAPVDEAVLKKMTGAMVHRGPDRVGHWVDGSVALGQCMLCTTPESLDEKQPLSNKDKSLILVLDGRVDNRDELRDRLRSRGRHVRENTDAELVLCAYEEWGQESPHHIVGDFAYALWDSRRHELFCARDVFGIRPFYYFYDDDVFLLASEMHVLFCDARVPQEPNEGMVAEHLAVAITSREETLFRRIQRLPPAHTLTVGNQGLTKQLYWCLDPNREIRYRTDEEYAEHFRSVFEDSVRCRLRSCGPVGSYMSGGLDSTSVSVTASSILGQRQPGGSLHTYSLVFPGEDHDESRFVADTAAFARLESETLLPVVHGRAFYEDLVARYRDFPGTPNGEPMLGPARAAAQSHGRKVLLTGLGGNPWLEGTWFHLADLLRAFRFGQLVRTARAYAHIWPRGSSTAWSLLVNCGLVPLIPEVIKNRLRSYKTRPFPWLPESFALRSGIRDRIRPRRNGTNFKTHAQKEIAGYVNSGWHVFGLEGNDRECAAYSIEERHPFYDRRVAECAFAFPEDMRCRGNEIKYVLRLAMAGRLPQTVLRRQVQAEFSACFWSALEDVAADGILEAPALRQFGWLDADRVGSYYRRRHEGDGHSPWLFWHCAGMELWARGAFGGALEANHAYRSGGLTSL